MLDKHHWTRAKGAGKLHLVLDHDGYLPHYAVVTEERESDLSVGREMDFPPGSIIVFDRGYTDYNWWLRLTKPKIRFVTRLKDSAAYTIAETRAIPQDQPALLADEVIFLDKQRDAEPFPETRSHAFAHAFRVRGRKARLSRPHVRLLSGSIRRLSRRLPHRTGLPR